MPTHSVPTMADVHAALDAHAAMIAAQVDALTVAAQTEADRITAAQAAAAASTEGADSD